MEVKIPSAASDALLTAEVRRARVVSLDASLLFAVSYVLFWLGVMWVLYRKQVFIKI